MSTQEQVCNLLKEIKPTKDLSGCHDRHGGAAEALRITFVKGEQL